MRKVSGFSVFVIKSHRVYSFSKKCAEGPTREKAGRIPEYPHWLCEFGDAGNDTSCERQFNLDHRGTRFYNQDSVLVIKRWFNRVEEDASGLTFQEWTPDVDTSRPPVAMLINSSELSTAGFKLGIVSIT